MATPVTQQGERVPSTPLPASPEPSALYLTSASHRKTPPKVSPSDDTAQPSSQPQPCPVEGRALFAGFHTEGPGLGTQGSMQDPLSQGTPRVGKSHPREVLILVGQDSKSLCEPSVRLPGCGSHSRICLPGKPGQLLRLSTQLEESQCSQACGQGRL